MDADGRNGNDTGLRLSIRVSGFRPCPEAQYVRRLLATEDNFSVPLLGDDIDLVPMGLPGPMPQTLDEVYADDDDEEPKSEPKS